MFLAGVLACAGVLPLEAASAPASGRVVILGFDGVDAALVEQMLAAGQLPALSALRERGGYSPLTPTVPAQTPVSWATFSTGLDRGGHEIFDFLKRVLSMRIPTFAVGAAPEYRNADEGWGIPTVQPFAGDPALSWHLIESLVADEFDITMCQEMLVDHAATLPMALLWPGGGPWPVRIVPIAMNHVQHPLPSPRRAYKLGQSVGRALDAWPEDVRVLTPADILALDQTASV
mgnify:CR=1 FL=1